MSNLITIKGTGKLNIKPDVVIFNLKLESKDFAYNITLEKMSKLMIDLEDAINKFGFKKDSLKTSYFNIDTNYENILDEKNVYKSEFVGYICNQWINVECDLDMELIGKILNSIGKTNINPNLSLNFSVKDKDKINKELLVQATKDANIKANILAETSLLKLGEIVNINYDFQNNGFLSGTKYEINNNSLVYSKSANIEFNPEDILLQEFVTITWELKNR